MNPAHTFQLGLAVMAFFLSVLAAIPWFPPKTRAIWAALSLVLCNLIWVVRLS